MQSALHCQQGCSPEGLWGAAPLLNIWKILGAQPPSNARLLNIFVKFFYSAVDLQTYLNICLQCQVCTNGGITPFLVEIMAANQLNFKFLLENLCHFIVTIREDVLSRNQQ